MKRVGFSLKKVVPVYRKYIKSDKGEFVLYGSRDSAKTFHACLKMLLKCIGSRKGKFKGALVRRHRGEVGGSLYAAMKKIIQLYKMDSLFDCNDHTHIITFVNGNQIVPLGLQESSKDSKGKGKAVDDLTDAIIDEADQITEEQFDTLDFTLRASENNQITLICNSVYPQHWIVRRWLPDNPQAYERKDGMHDYIPSRHDDAMVLHTCYKHNPYVSEKKKAKFERLPEKKYNRHALGLLRSAQSGGEAIPNYDESTHVGDYELNPYELCYIVQDFNKHPFHYTAIMQGFPSVDGKTFYLRVVKEITEPNTSAPNAAKKACAWLIKQGYASNKVMYAGDYSGNSTGDVDITSQVQRSLTTIGKYWNVIDRTKPNPPVVTSIEFVDDLFTNEQNTLGTFGKKQIVLGIDRNCLYCTSDLSDTKIDPTGRLAKVMGDTITINGQPYSFETVDNESGLNKKIKFQLRGHAVDVLRYGFIAILRSEWEYWKKESFVKEFNKAA